MSSKATKINRQQTLQLALFLRTRGLFRDEDLKQWRQLSDESGQDLIDIMLEQGPRMSQASIADAFSMAFGLPQVTWAPGEAIDPDVLKLVPKNFMLNNRIVPFLKEGTRLHVALSEPENLNKVSQLKLITEFDVEAHVATLDQIQHVLEAVAESDHTYVPSPFVSELMHIDEEDDDEDEFAEQAGSSEVILFVNEVIAQAIERGVSDIHIEPYKKRARLRLREDGVLHDQRERDAFLWSHYSAIITRIKIMAKLNIAERRLPQDGAITFKTVKGREVDLRVSILPTGPGERAVLRLLDHSAFNLELEALGFSGQEETLLKRAVEASQGMVLVTGPTGSGKSTTLYACLKRINQEGINILTAEDPIEYVMEGVGQVQVKEHIGLTFSAALRSFLRQDPEVILVGEIRDRETADIAIKASLTGHLVLSTLHTNDAISTVTRLINMGVPAYLVVAALTLVVGQRLVRKNCTSCSSVADVKPEQLRLIGMTPEEISQTVTYKGVGCKACNGTGYKGRQGVYELLQITPRLKQAILQGKSQEELTQIAVDEGFVSLQKAGLAFVKQGVLSVEEFQRVLIF